MRLSIFLLSALAQAADSVAVLKSVDLPFDPAAGYLPALLQALHIPVESQIAVFSKTSIQSLRIEPAHPRLLYFNDSVIVGSVHGGFLEIAAQDAEGIKFYALQQRPDQRVIPREDCLNCHKSGTTLLRSVIPTPDGIPSAESTQPWGGWFVTGHATNHLGNHVFTHSEPHELTPPVSSDIVALTVFAHQMKIMNLLAHPGNITELVDALVDPTPLPGPIKGNSSFAEVFESAGPHDRQGRSLRELDLQTRLLRYPCSYMIYSDAFNSLPSKTKAAVYRRLPKTVLEILRDTGFGKVELTQLPH